MRFRERIREGREERPAAVPAADGQDIQERAERLLARGGDAIDRALSMDSALFLRANRQEGGE
jgi:hypothetical protein